MGVGVLMEALLGPEARAGLEGEGRAEVQSALGQRMNTNGHRYEPFHINMQRCEFSSLLPAVPPVTNNLSC